MISLPARSLSLVFCGVLFMVVAEAGPGGFAFSTINPAGSIATTAGGVNNIGQIVGGETLNGGTLNGFLLNLGTFTTFNAAPGSMAGSYAEGINNSGQIVGQNLANGTGFLLSAGAFTAIVVPGSDSGTTNAIGINDSGQIAGTFRKSGVSYGFLLSGGTYTTITVPGATATAASGINNGGQIVGWYTSSGVMSGFLLNGGNYSTISFPGSTSTKAFGINNNGQIVGEYTSDGSTYGFLLVGGTYTSITADSLKSTSTVNTTLTVQAIGGFNAIGIPTSGSAVLTNIGSGTFYTEFPITPDSSGIYSGSFIIALSTGDTPGDTLYGVLKIPSALLSGAGVGSATIIGGTGVFFGATGSFPALAGTGSTGPSTINLQFSGAGAITAPGGSPITANVSAHGINDAGQIVGSYVTGGVTFGFSAAQNAVTVSSKQCSARTGTNPGVITAGPDGAMWFSSKNSTLGRITTSGAVTTYGPALAASKEADGIVTGSDGALWFVTPSTAPNRFTTVPGYIARMTTSGTVTQYPPVTSDATPVAIAAGSDGALWFTDQVDNQIQSVTTSGVFSSYPVPPVSQLDTERVVDITPAPDGSLWFTDNASVGRITTAGVITFFPLFPGWDTQNSIVAGPDGAMWFTGQTNQTSFTNQIGRIDASGAIRFYPVPPMTMSPALGQITAGPDGALWFTELIPETTSALAVGRITTSGVITQYLLPVVSASSGGIAAGPDGGVWFTEADLDSIGEIVVSGSLPPPQLNITKTHTGNFRQQQTNANYTVTVSNQAGAGSTTGTVTVTDTLPSGLSLVSIAGDGWICSSTTCSRNDSLIGGGSYPPITVTVNVASNATTPQVNQVSVQGGGSVTAAASDSTTIIQLIPILSVTKTHTGNFSPGQTNATYAVTVSNTGLGPTNGAVTVTDTLPSGLTLVSMAGVPPCNATNCSGWTCVVNSCMRSDGLAGGASYPAIIVTVSVAANATSPQVNAVTVSGGGSASASATDSTIIAPPPHPAFFTGEVSVGSGVYYLTFPDSNLFGYYTYLTGPFIYHYDMGFEYFIPANDANGEIYFYDFQSGHWWYTGPSLFPNLYDFTLGAWIFYFSDSSNPGHYTTNPRKFAYDSTHGIFTM